MEKTEIIFYALHYVCLLVELILILGERHAGISKNLKENLRWVSIIWTVLHIINLLFLSIVSKKQNRIYPLIALIFQIIIVVAKGIKHVKLRNISFIISGVTSIIGFIIKIIQVMKNKTIEDNNTSQTLREAPINDAKDNTSQTIQQPLIKPNDDESFEYHLRYTDIDLNHILLSRDSITYGKTVNDILNQYNKKASDKQKELFFMGKKLQNNTKLSDIDLSPLPTFYIIKNSKPGFTRVTIIHDEKIDPRNPLYVSSMKDLWEQILELYPLKKKDKENLTLRKTDLQEYTYNSNYNDEDPINDFIKNDCKLTLEEMKF